LTQIEQKQPIPKANTDEVARLKATSFNQLTERRHMINDIRFSFYNHAAIIRAIKSGQAVDLSKIPKRKDKPVLIVGSGPTLNEALPLVKDWQGDIICSTSQATTLVYFGHPPEHIVALDPDSRADELKADTWKGRNSILHMHPGISPDLLEMWEGPISLFRKLQPQTPFYDNAQKIGYGTLGPIEEGHFQGDKGDSLITSTIPMLACVIPAQIWIAKQLGYRQQFLVGCDFSFPEDIDRFTLWDWNGKKWVKHEPSSIFTKQRSERDPIIETEFEGLKSSSLMVFYGHQTVIAWRITEANIVNTSNKGFLQMFPYAPIEKVIRKQGQGIKGFNLKKIREISEEHLAKQNIYFLRVGKGIMPHEYKDPLFEIPKAIKNIKAALEKQGKGKDFDPEANMRRIKKLFKKVANAK